MLEHFENSDGLGAIFPPMIYTVIAPEVPGLRARTRPAMQWALRQLDDLLIEEDGTVRVQPCVSPVWDTAIATIALADAGAARRPPAPCSRGPLAARQGGPRRRRLAGPPARASSRAAGTSSSATSSTPTSTTRRWSCWPCSGPPWPTTPRSQAATRRGVDWLLAMQNRDGGWAAFDVDIDNQVLTKVPFADHNAMLDPSCADITARVLELLGTLGYRADHPAVARALDYLWQTQEPRGLLVRPLGRQLHLRHLAGARRACKAIDFPMDHPAVVRGRPTGSSRSSRPTAAGARPAAATTTRAEWARATPTASQTAWAVARPDRRRPRPRRRRPPRHRVPRSTRSAPTAPGTRPHFTGTGFPRVFYLKYHSTGSTSR